MTLPLLPAAPPDVVYALTVPQSVLFADLSLRGSRRDAFAEVFGSAFEVPWVVIDDGAMSWDIRGDRRYAAALTGTAEPTAAIRRFISAMGHTARTVEVISAVLGSPADRRGREPGDVLADLRQYWSAYERHMTSLFTFWNIEDLLSDTLVEVLKEHRLDDEVQSGLQRFLQPAETNYFSLERRHLARLAARFDVPASGEAPSPELAAALTHHVAFFGFLLAPFNLGAPPSAESVLDRLRDVAPRDVGEDAELMRGRSDWLADVPEPARELGLLAQELTFWKTERLDVMSLGDSRVSELYAAAAEQLDSDLEHLFAMRRHELEDALEGANVVSTSVLDQRLAGFCLLLRDGEIEFFAPGRVADASAAADSAAGDQPDEEDTIVGVAASRGTATGPVRLVLKDTDIEALRPGDVLVTTMTRPEMGAALDRAAAFVTDQGGRMSHAAIISREMGKPCVIGTETATTRLRNGMRVTVDGNNGIVVIVPAEPSEG